MKKRYTHQSLGQRLVELEHLQHDLTATLANVKTHHVAVMKKIAVLAEVEGFNVTLTPVMTEAVAIMIVWSCEKRREGISPQEKKEIETMISNIESVGFQQVDQHHDSHIIQAQFRAR